MPRKLALIKNKDPESAQLNFRYKLFSWLKKEDFEPAVALGVVVSVAGTLAASRKVGRWRFVWACFKAYGMERLRLLTAGGK